MRAWVLVGACLLPCSDMAGAQKHVRLHGRRFRARRISGCDIPSRGRRDRARHLTSGECILICRGLPCDAVCARAAPGARGRYASGACSPSVSGMLTASEVGEDRGEHGRSSKSAGRI